MHRTCFIPFSNTHGYSKILRQYVLTEPLSFSKPAYIYAEIQPRYQRYLWRVALADTQCSSYLLGNDDPAEVVDPSYDSCSFHIQISLEFHDLANACKDSLWFGKAIIQDSWKVIFGKMDF